MEMTLTGPSRPPLSCGKPKYLVVLLHGAESSAEEIIDLALDWAPTLSKAEFLAPELSWQDLEGGNGGPPSGQSMDEALERLQSFLDGALAARRLKDDRLALVGFAQGAAMALSAGLERVSPMGAVVAVARGLDRFPQGLVGTRSAPPVLLLEADLGQPSPELSLDEAERRLSDGGITVLRRSNPGSYYGLDDEGVGFVADYLHQALVAPSAD